MINSHAVARTILRAMDPDAVHTPEEAAWHERLIGELIPKYMEQAKKDGDGTLDSAQVRRAIHFSNEEMIIQIIDRAVMEDARVMARGL